MGKSGDQRTRMTKQLIRKAFMELHSRKTHTQHLIESCAVLQVSTEGLSMHIIKTFTTCWNR